MLYHFLFDPTPPLLFSSHGGETTRLTDYRKQTRYHCRSVGRQITEGLRCSSVPARALAKGGGGVGVIRWFQSWTDPGERNESLTLPRAGFPPDAEHT